MADEHDPPRPRWFAAGDPLRGLASLAVVVYHCAFNLSYQAQNVDFGAQFGSPLGPTLYRGGELGLHIFFVLSTYLIGRPFVLAYLRGEKLPDLKRYGRNRALRILPAFWAVFLIVLILRGRDGQSWGDMAKVFVLGGAIDNRGLSPTMGQTWSLGVELGFYVLVPVVALLAGRRGSVAGALAFFGGLYVASLIFRAIVPTTLFTLRSIPGMAYALMPGLMFAAIELRVKRIPAWAPAASFGLGALLFILTIVEAPDIREASSPGRLIPTAILTSLSAAFIVGGPLLAHWAGRPAWRILANPPFQWLGARAFSIFLVHQAIIFTLLDAGLHVGFDAKGLAKLVLIVVPLTLIAAAIIYQFVERPAMDRMRRWQPAILKS